jgi:hypothetical protein
MSRRRKLTLKRHDTAPAAQIALEDASRNPVDLTEAASVDFHMKLQNGTDLKVRRAAIVQSPATDGVVVHNWLAGDTDTAGLFNVEIEVTWNDGTVQTFPADNYITVEIVADLDDAG